MNEENQHDYIIAYIHGKLKGSKLVAFEEKKANDIDFSIEVDIYQVLIDEHRQEQRKKIEEWTKNIPISDAVAQENFTPKVITFFQSKKGIYTAAAILLLFLSVIFLFRLMQPTSNLSPKEYALNEVGQHHKQLGELGGEEDQKPWIKTYKKKMYRKTIPLLEKEIEEGPKKLDLYLYLGLCYLKLQPPDLNKAIEKLRAREKETIYTNEKNEANWFIAIAYLLQEDTQNAKKTLSKIKPSDEGYGKKAQELLNTLD